MSMTLLFTAIIITQLLRLLTLCALFACSVAHSVGVCAHTRVARREVQDVDEWHAITGATAAGRSIGASADDVARRDDGLRPGGTVHAARRDAGRAADIGENAGRRAAPDRTAADGNSARLAQRVARRFALGRCLVQRTSDGR